MAAFKFPTIKLKDIYRINNISFYWIVHTESTVINWLR